MKPDTSRVAIFSLTLAGTVASSVWIEATPFMDTSLYVGHVSAHWLQGGDIAFLVGFVVGLLVYAGATDG
jgi:hypothetical protein